MIEDIKNLIYGSEMINFQKRKAVAYIERVEEINTKNSDEIKLIESCEYKTKVDKVLYSSDEVKFYSIISNDKLDTECPIRFIVNKNGNWSCSSLVSRKFEQAFLCYLGEKYDGGNSQFASFASLMLGINK